MRTLIFDQPQRVAEWVCARIGGAPHAHMTAIGQEVNGTLISGVIFEMYTGRSIAMHVAGEGRWASHQFISTCFRYCFNQLKVSKVLGFVDSSNAAARRFDEHIGFTLEATVTGAAEGGDLLIYSMTPDTCRWLEK
jgi:RimJ/RimL family protein N-acetyltransferase